jgi:methionyl-tRNA synthetase
MDPVDAQILAQIDLAFDPIGNLLNGCKFKAALGEVMALAHEVNKYLDTKAPWFQIKEDRARAATTLYIALRVIDSLKILFAPFLPFSSQRLHKMLGYRGDLLGTQIVRDYQETTRSHRGLIYDASSLTEQWKPSQLPVGRAFGPIAPLFEKLDEKVVAEEKARLGAG